MSHPDSATVSIACCRSALVDHVSEVFGLRTNPKMTESRASNAVDDIDARLVIPDAGPIISVRAVVADFQPVRHWPCDNFPCKSMRGISTIAVRESSVTVASALRCPNPTRAGPVYAGPESLSIKRSINPHASPITSLLAESVTSAGFPVRQREWCTALRTCSSVTMRTHRDHPLSGNRGASPGVRPARPGHLIVP